MNTDSAVRRNLSLFPAHATLLLASLSAACSGDPACELVASAALPQPLREASGAAVDGAGRIWVHADSGEPALFHVDEQGRVVRELRIPDVRNDDWEDLAIGPCEAGECFFIGAIGDNLHERLDREILRVPVPNDDRGSSAPPVRFRFRYPDGPADAEALVALEDGSLLIVTKGRNRAVAAYRFAPPFATDSPHTLEYVQDLTDGIVQVPDQITGGSATGRQVVLRSYGALLRYEWTGDSLAVAGQPLNLRFLGEDQGEGVVTAEDGTLILVGEGQERGSFARLRCGRTGS